MVGTTPQAASAVFFISAISRLDSSWERLDDKLDELINCLEEITDDGEDCCAESFNPVNGVLTRRPYRALAVLLRNNQIFLQEKINDIAMND